MKNILAAMLFLFMTPAFAEDQILTFDTIGGGKAGTPAVMTVPACSDQFRELPALASRLGVGPMTPDDHSGAFVLTLCDGRSYNFIKLLDAFLDRLEKAPN